MPDIMKIDVEGAELLAIQGASNTISHEDPPITMIEYIGSNAAHFGGYSLKDLLAHFPENRFKSFRIDTIGVLREPADDRQNMTNDYLVVPLNKLMAVKSLLS